MLSWSAQEERRRTLWSIYLLDKMGTCGRGRPSLFLDQTCQLQLPCSEISFQISSYQKTATLEDFKGLDEVQIEHSGPFARTIAIASTLSQVAAYAFQQNKTSNQKAPWDHNSEFQMICSQLIRFETSFDSLQSLQALIQGDVPPAQDNSTQPTEMLVFSYILYNLCYCLLQHPFLLRRQWETSGARVPVSFSARALESCSRHAQELTQTLANANRAGYRVSASFFSYCSLVAGTVHCLFQHSVSEEMRAKSEEALRDSLAHLEEKAKYWPNAGRMVWSYPLSYQVQKGLC
jgi:hypothetical protein